MRPRGIPAENDLAGSSVLSTASGRCFNEAAGNTRGKLGWPSFTKPSVQKCELQ